MEKGVSKGGKVSELSSKGIFNLPNLTLNKRGQGTLDLPFQLIFSLILIAVFLYAAFTGIRYFLERADQVEIGRFFSELESKVNVVWQATEMTQTYSFELPKSIKLVCFGDVSRKVNNTLCDDFDLYRREAVLKGSNMFLCPPLSAYSVGAPVHSKIDCEGNNCLEFNQSVYCFESDEGITVTLKKEFGNPKVKLS